MRLVTMSEHQRPSAVKKSGPENRAVYRRLDFGPARLPKDFCGLDEARGLIFLTLPLIERRRWVGSADGLRAAEGSDGFPRLPPRAVLDLGEFL